MMILFFDNAFGSTSTSMHGGLQACNESSTLWVDLQTLASVVGFGAFSWNVKVELSRLLVGSPAYAYARKPLDDDLRLAKFTRR